MPGSDWEPMKPLYGEHGSATTAHVCHWPSLENQVEGFTPIGTMYGCLYNRLAWNHPDMRGLASYFSLTNIQGSGQGQQRLWPASIYSDEIRADVEAGRLTNGVPWSEWSVGFA